MSGFDLARTSASSPIRRPSPRITAHEVAQGRHDMPHGKLHSRSSRTWGPADMQAPELLIQTSTSHAERARSYDSETWTPPTCENCRRLGALQEHTCCCTTGSGGPGNKIHDSMEVVVGYVAGPLPRALTPNRHGFA
jgi:hypothetical protein